MKQITICLIEMYRNTLSKLKIGTCRFYPTCSDYTKEAIGKHGVFKGVYFGVRRILRCHQFSPGGYDPVP